MIERLAMMLLIACAVAVPGTTDAKPKQDYEAPILAPIEAPPQLTVQQDGRVVIEADGKTVVFQPSGSVVTIDTYDADMAQISRAVLTADTTLLPEQIDIDWSRLSAAVDPTPTCGEDSVPLASINYDGYSNVSMTCGMAMAILTAATVALGAACFGPQAATGICAAAIAAYLQVLDMYYTACASYTMRY